MRGHCYDALVGLAGCDKSLPGMMMAMVRLNVPSIFIYGGSILPGSFKGRRSRCRTCSRRSASIRSGDVGRGPAGAGRGGLPVLGSCGGQFTANTMATVAEAIGLALPYSCGAPAPYDMRDRFATPPARW
jgi:dihydroxy-acid dehydratase